MYLFTSKGVWAHWSLMFGTDLLDDEKLDESSAAYIWWTELSVRSSVKTVGKSKKYNP